MVRGGCSDLKEKGVLTEVHHVKSIFLNYSTTNVLRLVLPPITALQLLLFLWLSKESIAKTAYWCTRAIQL